MTMLTHFYIRINFALNRLGNAADQKRSVARVVILLAVIASGLSSCGFQLRGTGQTTILLESVYLNAIDNSGALARELIDSLEQSGVEFTSNGNAQVSIRLDRERFSRRPVSTTGQINVAEYELTLEVGFEVLTRGGDVLIPPTRIRTERIYTFDSSSLVGSNEEESLLNEEMRRDVIGQLLQRINASMKAAQAPQPAG
jgi:LPS-assembly lipoprotein